MSQDGKHHKHKRSASVAVWKFKQSAYQISCQEMGFKAEGQDAALLHIFNIAGYFGPEILWQQMSRSGLFKNCKKDFLELNKLLAEYGAGKEPKELKAESLSSKLFLDNGGELHSPKDISGFITYMAQASCDKSFNQRRSEELGIKWKELYKDAYIANTRKLGLIDSSGEEGDFQELQCKMGKFFSEAYKKAYPDMEDFYERYLNFKNRDNEMQIDPVPSLAGDIFEEGSS